jgi:hypothetical protein
VCACGEEIGFFKIKKIIQKPHTQSPIFSTPIGVKDALDAATQRHTVEVQALTAQHTQQAQTFIAQSSEQQRVFREASEVTFVLV